MSTLAHFRNEFADLFSRQIEALGRPGDIVIGITTWGESPNISKPSGRQGRQD